MERSVLIERVAGTADEALKKLAPGATKDQIRVLRSGLDEPLRVAVAGREKAGKSTFVNALLGLNIAPTDAGVCTKVVTWFSHGASQRVEIVPRSGARRDVPLRLDEDGEALIDLGAEPHEIQRVVIRLPLDVLRDVTIIDTPGLASINERLSGATRELLFLDQASRSASEKADALIFLMSPTILEDDRQALTEFKERFGGLRASAGNAIGVLSRADTIGNGLDDPWPEAELMAARQAQVLAGLVSSVVPVVGLLAESMSHFRTSDMANLLALARLDPVVREDLLLDARILLAVDCDVPVEGRQRLISLLGRYGLRRALEAVDGGTSSAGRMARRLEEWSGIGAVQSRILGTFKARSDALRAAAALAGLQTASYETDPVNRETLRWLRDEVERLELDPDMHRLNEIRAGEVASAADLDLPAPLRLDIHRLLTETAPVARLGLSHAATTTELLTAAGEGEARWRRYASDPGTPLRLSQVADVFARSHSLLFEDFSNSSSVAR